MSCCAPTGLLPDVVHTSLLRRAISTANLALDAADRHWIPVRRDWRLNERHYGALQGKDKKQTLDDLRRGAVHALAPLLRRAAAADRARPEFSQDGDPRYAGLGADMPATECLADVVERFLPYWEAAVVPDLRAGKVVLLAAHGNSLRALVKHLDGISDDGHRGAEHPHRHPAALRARRRPAPDRARRQLPGPGRGRDGGGRRGRRTGALSSARAPRAG